MLIMPHTVLVFDSYAEQEELALAQNGGKYRDVIDSLDEWLRQQWKYQNKRTVKIEDVRAKINELMNE